MPLSLGARVFGVSERARALPRGGGGLFRELSCCRGAGDGAVRGACANVFGQRVDSGGGKWLAGEVII